MAVSVQGYDIM